MKKALLIIALMVVVSCSSEIPPEPSGPPLDTTSDDLAGMAYRSYEGGYAPPYDVFEDVLVFKISPRQVIVTENVFKPVTSFEIDVAVQNSESLIYEKGYIYKSAKGWEGFKFTGRKHPASEEWILENAKAKLTLDPQDFETGENYVVAWYCKMHYDEWKCGWQTVNGQPNKWMLNNFLLKRSSLPPTPTMPGEVPPVHTINVGPGNHITEVGKVTEIEVAVSSKQELTNEKMENIILGIMKEDQVQTGQGPPLPPKPFDIKLNSLNCYEDQWYRCHAWYRSVYTFDETGTYTLSTNANLNNPKVNKAVVKVEPEGTIGKHVIEHDLENEVRFMKSSGHFNELFNQYSATYRIETNSGQCEPTMAVIVHPSPELYIKQVTSSDWCNEDTCYAYNDATVNGFEVKVMEYEGRAWQYIWISDGKIYTASSRHNDCAITLATEYMKQQPLIVAPSPPTSDGGSGYGYSEGEVAQDEG